MKEELRKNGNNGTQKFWVKDTKKVKFYERLSALPQTSITILKTVNT